MGKRPGVIREFFLFLVDNKAWWMVPIILVLLALMGIVVAAATPLGPFIYSLF
jgi:hypothetical protein